MALPRPSPRVPSGSLRDQQQPQVCDATLLQAHDHQDVGQPQGVHHRPPAEGCYAEEIQYHTGASMGVGVDVSEDMWSVCKSGCTRESGLDACVEMLVWICWCDDASVEI